MTLLHPLPLTAFSTAVPPHPALLLSARSWNPSQLQLLKTGIMFALPLNKGKHIAPRPSNINPLLVQFTGKVQVRVGSIGNESHRSEVSQQTCNTTRPPAHQREKLWSTYCKMCLSQTWSHWQTILKHCCSNNTWIILWLSDQWVTERTTVS